MKILFSPSEAKSDFKGQSVLNKNSFSFTNKFDERLYVLKKFTTFITKASDDYLQKTFGIKDINECKKLQNIDFFTSFTCKAIKRYTGVAYEYLHFDTLRENEQEFILNNTIIFSNLFGPILANDEIPYYKFKQGQSIDGFKPEVFYKEKFSKELDDYLRDELVIDLRAGFYEKFYKITQPYITMKFIKNGKVVSHWAKAYRGKVLRQLAKSQPNTIEEFENINFDGLHADEILIKGLMRQYIFAIIE